MTSVFPKGMAKVQGSKLENVTLRGFAGGWNAIESDLAMESSFLVVCKNMRRTPGGTQKVRYGSKWFADTHDQDVSDILDMEYFSGSIINVTKNGNVIAVNGDGEKVTIWSPSIASDLPVPDGAPPAIGWHSGLTSVDFVPYKNELIIHNGIDKPITISRELKTTYLQDLAKGSNVNVPIGRYGCVVANYHCVAGIADQPTVVYVSAVGTAGVFPGDPAPNDSITVDVGAFAPQGAIEIRGIAGFRSNLLVFFQDQTVLVKLGVYNSDGVHEPAFPDTMPSFGLLGHRCVTPVENDLLFSGLGGMSSARRNLLSVTGVLESSTLSDRIEPAYRETIGALTDDQQTFECFMLYDKLTHEMFLFAPKTETSPGRTFVYSFNTKLKYAAWSEYDDLGVTCGCTSFLGRVFYASGTRIYQHGNGVYPDEEYFADRILDHDVEWHTTTTYAQGTIARDQVTNETFKALVTHTSGTGTFAHDRDIIHRWEPFFGRDFDFEMELPWLDSKDPMRVKQLRYISLATKGTAEFTVDAYVDNLFEDATGARIFPPSLSMNFIGNEAKGAGYDAGPYGGGRRSNDPRLFKFPAKFKTLKIVIRGSRGGNLDIVNLSFLFSRGRYRR